MRDFFLLFIFVLSIAGAISNEEDRKFNLLAEVDDAENVTSSFIFPEAVYRKAYRYALESKELKHLTFEQLVQHINYLDAWQAPKEIVEAFPYYLAGYDIDNKPIWMAEAGKYNVKKWVIRGGKDLKNVQKYMFQAGIRILRSIAEKDKPGDEVTEGIFFGDMEGFDMSQVYHLPTVNFVMTEALKWRDIVALAIGRLIIVNVNYQGRLLVDVVRPIAGKVMERVEVFGTNKVKWIPELRRLLPLDAIPTWYGGRKNFKPVLVYG